MRKSIETWKRSDFRLVRVRLASLSHLLIHLRPRKVGDVYFHPHAFSPLLIVYQDLSTELVMVDPFMSVGGDHVRKMMQEKEAMFKAASRALKPTLPDATPTLLNRRESPMQFSATLQSQSIVPAGMSRFNGHHSFYF